jgi:hypothetical protein
MPIDVEKLALEAGFKERNGQIRVQHSNGSFVVIDEELSRFAALVLEAAAVQCDGVYYQHIGPKFGEVRYGVSECAKAIRAMKPGESNE